MRIRRISGIRLPIAACSSIIEFELSTINRRPNFHLEPIGPNVPLDPQAVCRGPHQLDPGGPPSSSCTWPPVRMSSVW